MLRPPRPSTAIALLSGMLLLGAGACGDDPPASPTPGGDVVGPAGGVLTFDGGAVRLSFPPGAVSSETTIEVTAVSRTGHELLVPGTAYEFDPDGLSFAAPVTLTLTFDPSNLPAGVRPDEVRVHREVGGQWLPVAGSTASAAGSTASAPLQGFSVYGLLGLGVSSVTVAPDPVQLGVGESVQLTATAAASGGMVLPDRPVSWATGNDAVATVDPSGLVSAVGGGETAVTATVEGVAGQSSVFVGSTVDRVDVAPGAVEVTVGQTVQLTATPRAADGTPLGTDVDWSTSAPGVASVDGDGRVTGVSAGTAQVTASSGGATGSATVAVTGSSSVSATVEYATFFGGAGLEEAREPVIFSDGRLLFGVRTYSAGMPATAGAIQSQYGGGDGDTFLAILSADGSALLAGTYLGGSGQERPPYGMALASNGDIIVTSGTDSPNFPVTAGALHPTLGAAGSSGYACRLSPDLRIRRWCTYVRGWPRGGLALTPEDDPVITGLIRADSNFPFTAGAYQGSVRGGDDVFLLKLRGDGSGVVFGTALGGATGGEVGLSVNVTAQDIVVGGITNSGDFPTTPGAPGRTNRGVGDGFLARVGLDGAGLNYSTMMGGSGEDEAKHRNEVLGDGSVVLGGVTFSSDFAGASGNASGPSDAWVGVLNGSGSGYRFLRYLGGSGDDAAVDRAVDAQGRIYVVGLTSSPDFPVTDGALQTTYGGNQDAFFTILDPSGTIVYSTFLGGSGEDNGRGVEIGPDGAVYLVGGTSSNDFPVTTGAWQTTRGGGQDGFAVKLRIGS